jgi:hypothetical protein
LLNYWNYFVGTGYFWQTYDDLDTRGAADRQAGRLVRSIRSSARIPASVRLSADAHYLTNTEGGYNHNYNQPQHAARGPRCR